MSEKEKPKKGNGGKKKFERTALTERTIEHALATGTLKPETYKLPPDHKWAGMWKIFAGLGVVGLAAGFGGYATNPTRFAFSYLFAFIAALMIAIGALMFVLIQHVASAAWSVVVRRVAELFGAGAVVFIVLFIPIAMSMNTLYPWLGGEHHRGGEANVVQISDQRLAQNEHAAPAEKTDATMDGPKALPDPEELEVKEVMHKKSAWLNKNGFLTRAFLYLGLWAIMGILLLRHSAQQDASRDPKLTVARARASAIGIILLAASLTFAAFDWMMSLEPTWYSTIFGVIFFANSVVGILAVLAVTLHRMHLADLLKKEVTIEHFHDIGKLLFGFLVFWAYVSFSQYMLIYYAALPEEVTFYHHRWSQGGDFWRTISVGIVIVRFVVPFFFILSRNVKRRPEYLQVGALIILVMNFVEAYWYVMPYAPQTDFAAGIWIDLACLVGVLGTYLAVVFWNMARYPLIPVGDPRLARSLRFVNA
jgi:hypothetical protein